MAYLKENGFQIMFTGKSDGFDAPQFTSMFHMGFGAGLIDMMDKAMGTRDIDLRYNTTATELLMDGDTVVGVHATDSNGD